MMPTLSIMVQTLHHNGYENYSRSTFKNFELLAYRHIFETFTAEVQPASIKVDVSDLVKNCK